MTERRAAPAACPHRHVRTAQSGQSHSRSRYAAVAAYEKFTRHYLDWPSCRGLALRPVTPEVEGRSSSDSLNKAFNSCHFGGRAICSSASPISPTCRDRKAIARARGEPRPGVHRERPPGGSRLPRYAADGETQRRELRQEQEELRSGTRWSSSCGRSPPAIEAANLKRRRRHRLGTAILQIYSMLGIYLRDADPEDLYMHPYYENASGGGRRKRGELVARASRGPMQRPPPAPLIVRPRATPPSFSRAKRRLQRGEQPRRQRRPRVAFSR
jgi:hypothetical protein